MVTLDEVAQTALALPDVTEGVTSRNRSWSVGTKMFAWERPFSKADLKRFGSDAPPNGPILGLRVGDLAEKEAVLAAGTKGVFTIPHVDGYDAVLVHLKVISKRSLHELLVDAWLACAPRKLAEEYVEYVANSRPKLR